MSKTSTSGIFAIERHEQDKNAKKGKWTITGIRTKAQVPINMELPEHTEFSSDSITKIGIGVFNERNIQTVSIPETYTEIGDSAFENCEDLKCVDIHGKISSVGTRAFTGCVSLEEVKFLKGVDSIAENAFDHCMERHEEGEQIVYRQKVSGSLISEKSDDPEKRSTFQENTEKHQDYSVDSRDARNKAYYEKIIESKFDRQEAIEQRLLQPDDERELLHIANQLLKKARNEREKDAIKKAIQEFKDYFNSFFWRRIKNSNGEVCILGYNGDETIVQVPSKLDNRVVTKIAEYAFSPEDNHLTDTIRKNRSSIVSIELPDSLLDIGAKAFSGCTALKEIRLPKNLRTLQDWVFAGCKNLKEVILPPNLTNIGKGTFLECKNLSEIGFPKTMTDIQRMAFFGCKSLQNLKFPENLQHIGRKAFSGCENLQEIEIPSSTEAIGSWAFEKCSKLTYVKLNKKLQAIADGLFEDCEKLEKIDIPMDSSMTAIGDQSFCNCQSLESIYMPPNINHIGKRAFYQCDNLTEIDFSKQLEVIEDSAFEYCLSLQKIMLPKSILYIGEFSFEGCDNIFIQVPAASYAQEYADRKMIEYEIIK